MHGATIKVTLNDVRTTTKSPNDPFLRKYPLRLATRTRTCRRCRKLPSRKTRVFPDLDYTVGEVQKVGNSTCDIPCPEPLWIWLVEVC